MTFDVINDTEIPQGKKMMYAPIAKKISALQDGEVMIIKFDDGERTDMQMRIFQNGVRSHALRMDFLIGTRKIDANTLCVWKRKEQ